MKLKNIKAIYNILLPNFPGYEAKGPLLFASPIDQILKGYYIEGSDFDANRFYVWVFVLPLYVPTKYISFNFGKRLTRKSGEYWSFTEPSIEELASDLLRVMRKEGLPFLSAFNRPLDLAPNASRILENPDDPYRREAVAYSLVLSQNLQP